jgi:hypothetical protein
MQKINKILLVIFLAFGIIKGNAQVTKNEVDPDIKKMVEEISAQNLETIVRKLVSFETRHSLSKTRDKKVGIGAARNWVQTEFEKYAKESNGRLKVEQDAYIVEADGRRITRNVEMKNVMATLKGTDPNDDRIIIVSGHIDSRATDVMDSISRAPGANDDASGVAIVMELARIMSKREFPCTLIFVALQGEEQGLYGARHMASKAKKENWNIIALLNNDIVGNSLSSETNLRDNTRLRVFSETLPAGESENENAARKRVNGENDSPSRLLARYIKETAEKYVEQINIVMIYRNDRFLRGGDHTPFLQAGFPAIRFSEMNENFDQQHQNVRMENGKQYGDLPEFMDFEYLKKNAGVNLSVMANLAHSPFAPKNVGVDISQLTNKTTILWSAPDKGKKPDGYYVLMRETSSPMWKEKFFVKETEITLPYSKDNYFFAVQSVDEKGHESIPVFPKPVSRQISGK